MMMIVQDPRRISSHSSHDIEETYQPYELVSDCVFFYVRLIMCECTYSISTIPAFLTPSIGT